MAGEPSNLFTRIGQNWLGGLESKLTGEPRPGSLEYYQKQTALEDARKAYEATQRDPNDPRAREALKRSLQDIQDLGNRGLKQQIATIQESLPGYIDAKGQLTDIETRQTTTIDSAQTDNELRKIGARRDIYGDIAGQELKLAEMDAGTRDAFIGYLERAQDKNLAAQADARKPNFMNVASLLTGLGATAAALFG